MPARAQNGKQGLRHFFYNDTTPHIARAIPTLRTIAVPDLVQKNKSYENFFHCSNGRKV
jgi:hypothetical protein